MLKNTIKYLLIFLVLFLFQTGTAKEVKNNSLWCFTLSGILNDSIQRNIVDFNIKYKDRKTGKWKSVAKTLCGWGYQPDFLFERCYQFYAPSDLRAFEITIIQNQQNYKILIDQFPDTLSKHKLIGFSHLLVADKNNQFLFKDVNNVKVSDNINPEMRSMDIFNTYPRIETSRGSYQPKSPIKIYIESKDTLQSIVLSGCGTPGTLYIVQQWLNGAWTDYQNMWGVKCVHQKYKVIRYIVGLTIDQTGLFRVVFDDRTENSALYPILVSNPFEIK